MREIKPALDELTPYTEKDIASAAAAARHARDPWKKMAADRYDQPPFLL